MFSDRVFSKSGKEVVPQKMESNKSFIQTVFASYYCSRALGSTYASSITYFIQSCDQEVGWRA